MIPLVLGIYKFLSTLPARGATELDGELDAIIDDFYPRSPRGERLTSWAQKSPTNNFYPRSPRGERRSCSISIEMYFIDFYPRSPRGERLGITNGTLRLDVFLSTLPARGATQEYIILVK